MLEKENDQDYSNNDSSSFLIQCVKISTQKVGQTDTASKPNTIKKTPSQHLSDR